MGLFSKKGPENLSLMQEGTKESPENKAEAPKTGAERVANFRKATGEKVMGMFKKVAELGKKFVGGFDRVAGKGVESYDSAKQAAGKGVEAFQGVMVKLDEFDPVDMAVGYAASGAEKVGEMGKAAGRGIKSGVEIGAGLSIMAARQGAEFAKAGAEWMDSSATKADQWIDQKYESARGWAGEQADNIQKKATAARESYRSGVEAVKGWKNQAMDAYHQKGFEAHFAKLSPQAQAASLERLQRIQGGQELQAGFGATA